MGIPRLESRSIRGRQALWAASIATALLLALAPSAGADVGETIILRCTHEESLSGFTQADYNKALKELSADTEEYSNCSALIRKAQTAAARGKGAGTGPAAAAAAAVAIPTTPAEQQSIAQAKHSGSGPVSVGNQVVVPGVVHANISSAFSTLPTPLLATVAFLLVLMALFVAGAVRNRIRASRAR
jgi:hypothetical protein